MHEGSVATDSDDSKRSLSHLVLDQGLSFRPFDDPSWIGRTHEQFNKRIHEVNLMVEPTRAKSQRVLEHFTDSEMLILI
jgi:hypothetical protein